MEFTYTAAGSLCLRISMMIFFGANVHYLAKITYKIVKHTVYVAVHTGNTTAMCCMLHVII